MKNTFLRGAAAALMLWTAGVAMAADRPYLFTNSAAAEEDEEQVWAVENWFRRSGTQRSLTVAPEYAFDPVNALQVEFRRLLDREEGGGHEIEVEYKHLFNRIARDGWGIGLVATLDFERPQGGPWQHSATALIVPVTLPIGEGAGLVHLNAGVALPREGRREWIGALAAEREVWRRTTLFAEWARDSDGRLLHGGLRHWIRRERLAVDIAWQRQRRDDFRGSGLVLGIAWYDL